MATCAMVSASAAFRPSSGAALACAARPCRVPASSLLRRRGVCVPGPLPGASAGLRGNPSFTWLCPVLSLVPRGRPPLAGPRHGGLRVSYRPVRRRVLSPAGGGLRASYAVCTAYLSDGVGGRAGCFLESQWYPPPPPPAHISGRFGWPALLLPLHAHRAAVIGYVREAARVGRD